MKKNLKAENAGLPSLEPVDRFVVDKGCVQCPHSGLTLCLQKASSLSLSVSQKGYSGKL